MQGGKVGRRRKSKVDRKARLEDATYGECRRLSFESRAGRSAGGASRRLTGGHGWRMQHTANAGVEFREQGRKVGRRRKPKVDPKAGLEGRNRRRDPEVEVRGQGWRIEIGGASRRIGRKAEPEEAWMAKVGDSGSKAGPEG